MAKNQYGKRNQQIPQKDDFQDLQNFIEKIPVGDFGFTKHQITVYQKEKRHTAAAQIIPGIVIHSYSMQSHDRKAGNTFDEVKMSVSFCHLYNSPHVR